jgi:hypothetical protein
VHAGPAQRENAAVCGERQFGLFDDLIAAVGVAEPRRGSGST